MVLGLSAKLNNPMINYVVLAGCGIQPLAKVYPQFESLEGNFLSLVADSDTIAGSCAENFSTTSDKRKFKEVVIKSAAGHRLFFAPQQSWLDPMMAWTK